MTHHRHGTARHGTARHGTARHSTARRHQQGFTLVEIGVVLVIIGLLLGAVLKGQELIASARVSNLISKVNGYRTAINAFQDRYRMMPGDSSTAATKVGNGAINCTELCDDGMLNSWSSTSIVNNNLFASGFYSGPALAEATNDQPMAKPWGYLDNTAGGTIFLITTHFYLISGGAISTKDATHIEMSRKLSSKFLGEVDRRTDDGNAWTGRMRASSFPELTAGCLSSTTGVWIEENPGTNCTALDLL